MAIAMEVRDTEVVAKATRRRFTAEYKRKVLQEASLAKAPGEIGALLRREGLYSSHLTSWRAARERGEPPSNTAQDLTGRSQRCAWSSGREHRRLEVDERAAGGRRSCGIECV